MFGKRFHLTMLFINAFFVVANAAFMYVSTVPSINFICAIFCLGGCLSSWSLYVEDDEP